MNRNDCLAVMSGPLSIKAKAKIEKKWRDADYIYKIIISDANILKNEIPLFIKTTIEKWEKREIKGLWSERLDDEMKDPIGYPLILQVNEVLPLLKNAPVSPIIASRLIDVVEGIKRYIDRIPCRYVVSDQEQIPPEVAEALKSILNNIPIFLDIKKGVLPYKDRLEEAMQKHDERLERERQYDFEHPDDEIKFGGKRKRRKRTSKTHHKKRRKTHRRKRSKTHRRKRHKTRRKRKSRRKRRKSRSGRK